MTVNNQHLIYLTLIPIISYAYRYFVALHAFLNKIRGLGIAFGLGIAHCVLHIKLDTHSQWHSQHDTLKRTVITAQSTPCSEFGCTASEGRSQSSEGVRIYPGRFGVFSEGSFFVLNVIF